MNRIDLHMHTTASDGKLSPEEIVDWAIEKEIPVISITDHDTVEGSKKAINYSKGKKIRVVPGIEVTADPQDFGGDLHIVGLFVDYSNDEFEKMTSEKIRVSKITAQKIIGNLNKFGFDITIEEVEKETQKQHYGRPHIARVLLRKYPDRFKDRKQVFNEFLGSQGKAYVPPIAPNLKQVIDFIHKTKGLAILAHSWYFKDKLDTVLNLFLKSGGDGIEIISCSESDISQEVENKLRKFANDNNLVVSSGTDFHEKIVGEREIGDRGINLQEFNKLAERHRKIFLEKDL
ncbi:MAG TPA: PHP domain-containing protein [Candidatus Nanoarchaeia archaeon]|nr:PHP domain-containing protein [Candidatus Nanoarchaeia archaeon]